MIAHTLLRTCEVKPKKIIIDDSIDMNNCLEQIKQLDSVHLSAMYSDLPSIKSTTGIL